MPIPREKVYIGARRVATPLGAHWIAALINLSVCMIAFVMSENLIMLALMIPVHGLLVLITQLDRHVFRLIGLNLLCKLKTIRNRRHWHASSHDPFPRRLY